MKKSDRIILGLFLAALAVIGLSNFVLYGEYRKGHVRTTQQLEVEHHIRVAQPMFRTLVLSGTIWVNVIPADSFAIEFPKDEPGEEQSNLIFRSGFQMTDPTYTYRLSGDTLTVQGNNESPILRGFVDWYYRRGVPQVNVYAPRIDEIRIKNGQMLLSGAGGLRTASPLRLQATNSTIWIGDYNEPIRKQPAKEYFDSLDIRLTNSVMLLNYPAVISQLKARLDSSSEINDRWSTIGVPAISASSNSRVSLTGSNLTKTTISVH